MGGLDRLDDLSRMGRCIGSRVGRGTQVMLGGSSAGGVRGVTFLPLSSLKIGHEVATSPEFGTEFLHVHIVAHDFCKTKTRVSNLSDNHGLVAEIIPRNRESGSSTSGRHMSARVLRGRGSCLTASMTSFSSEVS